MSRMTDRSEEAGASAPASGVCPEHLRFVPCRRCQDGSGTVTEDSFIVEIARRYQRGELDFVLETDSALATSARERARLLEEQKDWIVQERSAMRAIDRNRESRVTRLEGMLVVQTRLTQHWCRRVVQLEAALAAGRVDISDHKPKRRRDTLRTKFNFLVYKPRRR